MKKYAAGDLWPLTLTKEQRATASALCDLIIPADDVSPAASSVGVVDFIDEWISAPYPEHAADRQTVIDGLSSIDAQAQRQFKAPFAKLSATQMTTIADAIVAEPFFERYRALTAGGFYTTPIGTRDLKFVGNVATATFEGPPKEVLRSWGWCRGWCGSGFSLTPSPATSPGCAARAAAPPTRSVGASVSRSAAVCVFGNAMTSRMLSVPAMSITMRSRPNAMPPCGGAPNFSASSRKPNFCCASSRADAEQVEHRRLHVLAVNTHRAAADLRAVQHHVVGLRERVRRIRAERGRIVVHAAR